MVRCFIALDLESEELARNVKALQTKLDSTNSRFRHVSPKLLHLTIQFLGEVPESLINNVKSTLSSVHFKPISIVLEGVGAFPSIRRPRVIWIGVSKGGGILETLAKKVNDALLPLGYKPDKPFHPHLTVSRVKFVRDREKLTQILIEERSRKYGEVLTSPLRLKKSTLTSRGPIYETLYEV